MKVLITTLGSAGDVNPLISVGAALQERGHQVVLLANSYFEQPIREAGLEFSPLGERFDLSKIATTPDVMDKRRGSTVLLKEFLIPNLPEILETVDAAIERERPDLVVAHNLCVGVRWVCERREVFCALTALSPLLWFSAEEPGIFRWWEPARQPVWYRKMRKRLVPPILRWSTDRPLNEVRARFGFAPQRDLVLHDALDSALMLGLWSPQFRGPMDDDPANSRICGFTWFDRPSHPDAVFDRLNDFLGRDEPPIVFTLGTSAVHVAGHFYRCAAEACRHLGRRGLLLTGGPENTPNDLPSDILAVSYAPFSQILPRGCATVHHGGIGTTAQAMRAGKPMVIVPFAHDQFDNAARTQRMGISVTVRREKVSVSRLVESLSTVLDDSSFACRAQSLGKLLSAEDGAIVAAERLEQAVGMAPSRTPVESPGELPVLVSQNL